MRMLITGGAGFLGSHMCDLMIAEGHQVICMDNFLTGRPENIAHLIGNPQFELIDYDVTNYITSMARSTLSCIWPVRPARSTLKTSASASSRSALSAPTKLWAWP